MKALFDDKYMVVSDKYIKAIISLMKAECNMMPDKEWWYWGRCVIVNLSSSNCLEFEFGDKDSMPKDGKGRFAVLVEKHA